MTQRGGCAIATRPVFIPLNAKGSLAPTAREDLTRRHKGTGAACHPNIREISPHYGGSPAGQTTARSANCLVNPLIANVIQHFEYYCPLSQVPTKSYCTNPGWRTPFLRKYLPSPFPSRKKNSCTDECHKGKWHGVPVPLSHSMSSSSASTSPAVSAFLVHVKQTVSIELHALRYLNPKMIVNDAIPVHINPALGKFVGV